MIPATTIEQYPTVIMPDTYPDGTPAWVASHPDLPGCTGHGKTPEEARNELAHARRAYVQHLKATGREVPIPWSAAGNQVTWAPLATPFTSIDWDLQPAGVRPTTTRASTIEAAA